MSRFGLLHRPSRHHPTNRQEESQLSIRDKRYWMSLWSARTWSSSICQYDSSACKSHSHNPLDNQACLLCIFLSSHEPSRQFAAVDYCPWIAAATVIDQVSKVLTSMTILHIVSKVWTHGDLSKMSKDSNHALRKVSHMPIRFEIYSTQFLSSPASGMQEVRSGWIEGPDSRCLQNLKPAEHSETADSWSQTFERWAEV